MWRNVLIVARRRTPYVGSREQSPSFEALSSVRLERSDGSLRTGPGWRPHRKLGAAGLRRDCQAGGGYRKPEVGRTEFLGPAVRCFPVLASVWPFDGSMAQRPPRPTEAAWPPVARAGKGPNASERAHGKAHAHRCEPPRGNPGGRRRWNTTGRIRFRNRDPQAPQGQHLPGEGHSHRTVAAGGVRGIWRQPPRLS